MEFALQAVSSLGLQRGEPTAVGWSLRCFVFTDV
jgi:hypothetical protein